MTRGLFWLVGLVIVTIATGAPVANQEEKFTAVAGDNTENGQRVAKRAEEMVFYGNRQNQPRVPVKKSDPFILDSIIHHPMPQGEVDESSSMVAHSEIPVEEDLNARAEAVRGPSEEDRLKEGLKYAEEEVEKAVEGEEGGEDAVEEDEEEGSVESKGEEEGMVEGDDENSIVNAVSNEEDNGSEESNDRSVGAVDVENNDVDVSDDSSIGVPGLEEWKDNIESDKVVDEESSDDDDDDEDNNEDVDSGSESSSSEGSESENSNTGDSDVEDILKVLSKEEENSDESTKDNDDVKTDESSNDIKSYNMAASAPADPSYYQIMYHILANSYRGGPADDYYSNYNLRLPYGRRRRSPLASMRRRSGHVRRIKRDLASDWLAAYNNGYAIPLTTNDLRDSLLSEQEDAYDDTNDELSRYIYGNLLNRLANSYEDDEDDGIPYADLLPNGIESEEPASLLDEYQPEDLVYGPELFSAYQENPYEEEYIPEYRKRSGSNYYADSRRKRYFFPAYEEPETHWGAFVPEKRDYDGALRRLQRLALALGDNPSSYYDSLLGEYKKK